MAQESCNLDNEEAELLKPSPSSPSPAATSPPPPPPPVLLKPCDESLAETPLPAAAAMPASCEKPPSVNQLPPVVAKPVVAKTPAAAATAQSAAFGNRCSVCKKRTGLAGFRCRCGNLFCGQHRHSETHDCSFDYKTWGREEIARANPVIRAAKIMKI